MANSRYLHRLGRWLVAPSVAFLLLGTVVPLAMTLWFSLLDYRLLVPGSGRFVGFANYSALFTDPAFIAAIGNTILLVGTVLAVSVAGGVVLALLLNRATVGRGMLRVLVISPFFVMPTVSALVWKNLLMNPVSGVLTWLAGVVGQPGFDWFARAPLLAITVIVAWQWLPFAALIFLTSLQSLDRDQREAAALDGATALDAFRYLTMPHLARPIAIVVMMETIFILSLFAEIFVTTGGGPGTATTNVAFLVYAQALLQYNVGGASAAGIVAVVLANIVAIVLVRVVGRSLDA